MILDLNPNSADDYATFLKIKSLPRCEFHGRQAHVPDEYAHLLEIKVRKPRKILYESPPRMFDYQRDISATAIHKKKYCVFMEPGRGKTYIMFEHIRHASEMVGKKRNALIVSPLMVIKQTLKECQTFYGDDLKIQQVRAAELQDWLKNGKGIGITNYEAITDGLDPGRLGALDLDESSLLKSHYGKWGTKLIDMGRGLEWKLACTGTPAPNDRIEYANHAVFMDAFPNTNSFLARFFVNRGQTDNRWEMKPHALEPFYRALSHFAIFVTNPATYGWKDGTEAIPPINVTIEDVPMTPEQRAAVQKINGNLFGMPSGIVSRSQLSQIAKGWHGDELIPTNKPAFIRDLIAKWPDESTLVWCLYNKEQDFLAKTIPNSLSMSGDTPEEERAEMIEAFKERRTPTLISKSKVLGWGLNLQVATRQVFSGIMDSYEAFWQCLKRSNRIGSTLPLNAHIPVTDVERPMVDTVLSKAKRVEADNAEQEQIFRDCARKL